MSLVATTEEKIERLCDHQSQLDFRPTRQPLVLSSASIGPASANFGAKEKSTLEDSCREQDALSASCGVAISELFICRLWLAPALVWDLELQVLADPIGWGEL